MLRNTNAEMVLPKNAVKMTEDEMMYVEGGNNLYTLSGGALLYAYGTATKNISYSKKVRKQNGVSTVSYKPSKNERNYGTACQIIGVSAMTSSVHPGLGFAAGTIYGLRTASWEK